MTDPSQVVQAPQDVASLAALLAQANESRTPFYPRGGGTKSGWWAGAAESATILSTTALAPVLSTTARET